MKLNLAPGLGDVVVVPLVAKQITATAADVAQALVPCKGRIVGVSAYCADIGGTTVPSDVDIMVEKGATDVLSAAIAVVDSATISAPTAGTLSTTAATLAVAEGDVLHLDATVAGGSGPTADGVVAYVYIARE